jgi:hypothetical protein
VASATTKAASTPASMVTKYLLVSGAIMLLQDTATRTTTICAVLTPAQGSQEQLGGLLPHACSVLVYQAPLPRNPSSHGPSLGHCQRTSTCLSRGSTFRHGLIKGGVCTYMRKAVLLEKRLSFLTLAITRWPLPRMT